VTFVAHKGTKNTKKKVYCFIFSAFFVPLRETKIIFRAEARRTQRKNFFVILRVLCVSARNKKYISRRDAENAKEENFIFYFVFFVRNLFYGGGSLQVESQNLYCLSLLSVYCLDLWFNGDRRLTTINSK
jgi:hypothetical protein